MQTLSVQFQPQRAAGITNRVCELMLRIALESDVRTFSVEGSRARNGYLNFMFASAAARLTWRAVQRIALSHRTLGRQLRHSTIVTCQGTRGWNNDRLLHHFDPRQRRRL